MKPKTLKEFVSDIEMPIHVETANPTQFVNMKTPHTDIEETLEERLRREAREMYSQSADEKTVAELLDEVIYHTISETLKEAVRVIEGLPQVLVDVRKTADEPKDIRDAVLTDEALTTLEGLTNKTNHD